MKLNNVPNLQIENPQLASYQYKILKESILEFQESLNPGEEVAIQLSSFGQSMLIHINDIGYSNPCLLHFYGVLPDGSETELIQRVNQLSFLLIAKKKLDPEAPARRMNPIGFQVAPEDD